MPQSHQYNIGVSPDSSGRYYIDSTVHSDGAPVDLGDLTVKSWAKRDDAFAAAQRLADKDAKERNSRTVRQYCTNGSDRGTHLAKAASA